MQIKVKGQQQNSYFNFSSLFGDYCVWRLCLWVSRLALVFAQPAETQLSKLLLAGCLNPPV